MVSVVVHDIQMGELRNTHKIFVAKEMKETSWDI